MSQAEFEAFVKHDLGDIAVMDEGRYISPKIQKYWLTWQAARAPLQAKIDALMLEYCPDEMTPEQIDEWERHQRPVSREIDDAVQAALGLPSRHMPVG
jgi:hypothetical protein